MNPNILTDEQRLELHNQFKSDKARIDQLARHNRAQLAAYVRQLAASVPKCAEEPRWMLYNWTLMDVSHYEQWSKRELVQRVLVIETDDRKRVSEAKRVARIMEQQTSEAIAIPADSASTEWIEEPTEIDEGAGDVIPPEGISIG